MRIANFALTLGLPLLVADCADRSTGREAADLKGTWADRSSRRPGGETS